MIIAVEKLESIDETAIELSSTCMVGRKRGVRCGYKVPEIDISDPGIEL